MQNKNESSYEYLKLKTTFIYAFYKQLPYMFVSVILFVLVFFFSKIFTTEIKFVLIILFSLSILKALHVYLFYILLDVRLYEDRMIFREGVFSKRTNFLELYRVTDYNLYQSFFMRIFKIQNIVLITSDKLNSIIQVKGVANSNVLNDIRTKVEIQRKIKGVRYFE